MSAPPPCRLLEWDTAFFGTRIAILLPGEVTPQRMAEAVEWCRSNSIACLYVRVDGSDEAAARVLEDVGARNVDERLTFVRALTDVERVVRPSVRLARPEDVPYLRKLAAKSHGISRFWADEGFSRERCAELYATWIEKSCRGWVDRVFVAEFDGKPVGYMSCTARDETTGELALLAVDPVAQGKRLGSDLFDTAMSWFVERGLERAIVVTQGRNTEARRLYVSRGFQLTTVQNWYHLWFSEGKTSR